jgi:cation diffusion facilitator CzcD-associated flavoprotein CzcO
MSRPATDARPLVRRLVLGAAAALTVALLVAAGVRVYQINALHPNPTLVEYQQGEVIRKGDFEITVTRTRLLSYGELLELVPTYAISVLDEQGEALDGSRLRMLAVDVSITNTSADERELVLYHFNAQSQAWHNGIDMYTFQDMNGGGSLTLSLLGGESAQVTLPYSMVDVQFKSARHWAQADERPYELVLATYPVYEVVHLRPTE